MTAKERPIIFSGEMVRAILDGRKTMTRRVVKCGVSADCESFINVGGDHWAQMFRAEDGEMYPKCWSDPCPFGQKGDRLWLKESWQVWTEFNSVAPDGLLEAMGGVAYPDVNYLANGNKWDARVRSPIHMPRWASRITLEITDVRVERLNEISEGDASKEGVERIEHGPHEVGSVPVHPFTSSYRDAFVALWNKINGKKHPWNLNPWVWKISFKKLEGGAP